MSVIGEFTVPAESFVLEPALSSVPEISVEADRNATHGPRQVLPFLWATGGDFEAFADALEADPSVESVSVAERADEAVMYRLRWCDSFRELVHDMIDHEAAIVEATASEDRWTLRLRFGEESMVSSFQEYFDETGRHFEVRSLWHPTGPRQREFDLTSDQYEALTTAAREGYFDVPRRVSATDLGDRLGISANAASQRVRRGSAALVRNTLLIDGLDGSDGRT
ncbi:bacterio-opsin activator domain-containing protein [Halosimplex amylolyticum]|uniref:helix-turn-helix domain-containing protein n=1 Tax=Halosimplex amylolyticum TaxID=3396616 RepID=UPI003F570454